MAYDSCVGVRVPVGNLGNNCHFLRQTEQLHTKRKWCHVWLLSNAAAENDWNIPEMHTLMYYSTCWAAICVNR